MSSREYDKKIRDMEIKIENLEETIDEARDILMKLMTGTLPNMNQMMNMLRKEYIETFENLDGYLIAFSNGLDGGKPWRLPGTSWPRFDDEGNKID